MADCILVGSGGGSSSTIKTLRYIGTNSSSNTITFPEAPTIVLGIVNTPGTDSRGYVTNCDSFIWGEANVLGRWTGANSGTGVISLSYNGNTVTINGADAGAALNYLNAEYIIYYTSGAANVLSSSSVKALIYTGTGTASHDLTFPEKPTVLFALRGQSGNGYVEYVPVAYGSPMWNYVFSEGFTLGSCGHSGLTYSQDMLTMTMTHSDSDGAGSCNLNGVIYTLYYI